MDYQATQEKIKLGFEKVNKLVHQLEAHSEGTWDSDKLSFFSSILNELADLESRVGHLRKKLAHRLLAKSNDCCPNCNQQLIEGLESCVFCNWNTGTLLTQKTPQNHDSQQVPNLSNILELAVIASLFHVLLNTKEPD